MSGNDRKVLLCIDPSENSKFAFNWFIENVYRPNDYIMACHIPEAPVLPSFSFKEGLNIPSAQWMSTMEKNLEQNKQLYNNYEQELITRKIKYKMVGEYSPKPGKAIINCAVEEGVDCIVMGTRSLSGVKRAFVGSVSNDVITHSRVPVIVCPLPHSN